MDGKGSAKEGPSMIPKSYSFWTGVAFVVVGVVMLLAGAATGVRVAYGNTHWLLLPIALVIFASFPLPWGGPSVGLAGPQRRSLIATSVDERSAVGNKQDQPHRT